MKLYTFLAVQLARYRNLTKPGFMPRVGMPEDLKDAIDAFVKEHFPSGSGFDAGTKLNWETSTPDRLVFTTEFHHMSEHGYYDGWTNHSVVVTPSLAFGFDLRVSGKNRNDIKDFIADGFNFILHKDEVWRFSV